MRPAPLLLAALLLLPACAGEGEDPQAGVTTAPLATATRPGSTCPVTAADAPGWPKDVPKVPTPSGLKIIKVDRSKGNINQVRGLVPTSIVDATFFIVREYPRAGFVLGRGDAEQSEADAPFQRGPGLRGLVRVFATEKQCETLWLFAVVRNTDQPYDLSYTPPPSSTPLPFG